MRNVIITGAGGFIGSRFVSYLLDKGVRIGAIVLPLEKNILLPHDNMTVIVGDIMEPETIYEQIGMQNYDVLYHFAWAGVSTDKKNDAEIQLLNIRLSFAAMDLAEKLGCTRVVYPGSVSEYAYAEEPVNGKQPPSPGDLYAATKVAVHHYCDILAKQKRMDFNWVLIPSIYGPGREDNNLITYTIKALLAGERPSLTGLEQQWDYIYIDDLVNALYLVGEKGSGTKTYVVGSGAPRRMSEYVEIIRQIINPCAELGIGELPYKNNRVDNAVTDISEIRRDIAFEPEVSFEQGISATIEYFRNRIGD